MPAANSEALHACRHGRSTTGPGNLAEKSIGSIRGVDCWSTRDMCAPTSHQRVIQRAGASAWGRGTGRPAYQCQVPPSPLSGPHAFTPWIVVGAIWVTLAIGSGLYFSLPIFLSAPRGAHVLRLGVESILNSDRIRSIGDANRRTRGFATDSTRDGAAHCEGIPWPWQDLVPRARRRKPQSDRPSPRFGGLPGRALPRPPRPRWRPAPARRSLGPRSSADFGGLGGPFKTSTTGKNHAGRAGARTRSAG